jgi:tetratricopeptide (TPR) repeat protein
LTWQDAAAPWIPSADEVFGLDDAMRALVAPLRATKDPAMRLRRLIDVMKGAGLFSLEYATTSTGTARATFEQKHGNCLSFTIMFVALARATGLDVRFQLVDVLPTWTNDLGLMVVGNHVNAAVGTGFQERTVVDFNSTSSTDRRKSLPIGDREVLAMFYNNLGAEALGRSRAGESLALLRSAARMDPGTASPWINLGVLHARAGRYDYAEAAYMRALEIDPRAQSALANLVSVYEAIGETALAGEYRARIRRYREMNPYYHFALAQRAYDEKRFDEALGAVRAAIRLKRDDGAFYLLQGRTLVELGQNTRAAAAFAQAHQYATAAR